MKITILTVEVISIVFVLILVLFAYQYQIPFVKLSANPVSSTGEHFYTGILYKVGIVFWSAVVTTSLISFLILRYFRYDFQSAERFAGFSFLFFGYFLADEIFQLHGTVFPKFFGIKQLFVLGFYAIFAIIFFIYFRGVIKKNKYITLIIAFLFLATSYFTDILSYLKVINFSYRYILDDGSKFLGIVNLFIFYLAFCFNNIISMENSKKLK